ncbi:MAG: hypothetical protein H6553_11160 [Chitinophagales bacterium]|nr:hypothetical protein [Chitinophagales bacterium]
MRQIIVALVALSCIINIACKKDCKEEEVIDPNKVYTGVVVRYYNPECVSTGLNTPPYLMRVNDYVLDSFITMTLPSQYRIEGKQLNFKIAEDSVNIAYLICNASIINGPKLLKIDDITE